MEYRGVEYVVVRSITRNWRWSVNGDHDEKGGTAPTQAAATRQAQKFIDGLLRAKTRQAPVQNARCPR